MPWSWVQNDVPQMPSQWYKKEVKLVTFSICLLTLFHVSSTCCNSNCRKSRAKVGRPLGSKNEVGTSTPKRQKVGTSGSPIPSATSGSPGPVTRSQLALSMEGGGSETYCSPGPVTRSQLALSMEGGGGALEGASTFPTTPARPTKLPAKRKKAAVKKKLTPKRPTK
ncbi:uncharacterized protein LOC120656599 isoform X3 [Panicum virgatum]|uniref:uncharacterized protein LOC120656599 isoform X3 n=1 Tax=Panicum virgatum TaxID=38727 RepID=UPI0019D5515A|nr:uncharacterized protein LOC120656599 isoform X3 [Panicum virgatum]